MKLESHATIVIKTDKGERELDVKDLNYNPDTMMFTYVYGGKYNATCRESVRGYRERKAQERSDEY